VEYPLAPQLREVRVESGLCRLVVIRRNLQRRVRTDLPGVLRHETASRRVRPCAGNDRAAFRRKLYDEFDDVVVFLVVSVAIRPSSHREQGRRCLRQSAVRQAAAAAARRLSRPL